MAGKVRKSKREIGVRIRLTLTQARLAMLSLLFVVVPLELGSETITLSTTYPSPVGIYNRLITTGSNGASTLLARDGANVGVGNANPQSKLDVAKGGITVRGNNSDGGGVTINQGWNQAVSINSNQIWKSVTAGDPTLYLQWSNPGGNTVIGGQGGAPNHLYTYGGGWFRDWVQTSWLYSWGNALIQGALTVNSGIWSSNGIWAWGDICTAVTGRWSCLSSLGSPKQINVLADWTMYWPDYANNSAICAQVYGPDWQNAGWDGMSKIHYCKRFVTLNYYSPQ